MSHRFRARFLAVFAVAAVSVLFAATILAAPSNRPLLEEKGFKIHQYDSCGLPPGNTTGPKSLRPQPYQITDIECSPGGAWGDFVYLSISGRNSGGDQEGYAQQVDLQGNSAGWPVFLRDSEALDLTFSPLGWRGGDLLFLTWTALGAFPSDSTSAIQWFDPSGQYVGGVLLVLSPPYQFGPAAVDPTGAFGSDLFYTQAGVGVVRMDSAGVATVFASGVEGPEMRFGPGGAWGTDLYIAGMTIDPTGAVTTSPASFGEFDWAEGPGFGGDLFDLEAGSPGYVYRVKPDGTRTLWATVNADQIAFCGGSLWLAGPDGCYVVTPTGP